MIWWKGGGAWAIGGGKSSEGLRIRRLIVESCFWVVRRLGPYVVQEDTPLGQVWLEQRKGQSEEARKEEAKELFSLTTRMYALARVMLGDVNIAATTALQVRRIPVYRGQE